MRSWLGEPPRLQGWMTLALGPLLVLTAPRLGSGARRERLMGAIELAGSALALYALAQRAGLDPLSWEGLESVRPGGMQGNPLFLGGLLVLSAPVPLGRSTVTWSPAKAR